MSFHTPAHKVGSSVKTLSEVIERTKRSEERDNATFDRYSWLQTRSKDMTMPPEASKTAQEAPKEDGEYLTSQELSKRLREAEILGYLKGWADAKNKYFSEKT